MYLQFVIFALILLRLSAFPGGAPIESCSNLMPQHGTSISQPYSTNPYILSFAVLVSSYSPGQDVTLVIDGGQPFRYFIVSCLLIIYISSRTV